MAMYISCLLYLSLVSVLVWSQKYVIPSKLFNIYDISVHTIAVCVMSWYVLIIAKKLLNYKEVSPINRSVFITGCDTGFGHALAKKLDSKGFKVFAGCLFPSGDGAKSLQETCSSSFHVLGLDVTKDESVKDAVNYVQKNLNGTKLWAIVNNAGVVRVGQFELLTKQDIQIQMDVNAMGVVNVTKTFLPFVSHNGGRIVNLTSMAGRIPVSCAIGYIMSKYAATAFSECLRQEVRSRGIKVVTIEPEMFRTPLIDSRIVLENLNNSRKETEEKIKDEHELDYIKKLETVIYMLQKFSSNKIHKVINALEEAICLEEPCEVYRPMRNVIIWFAIYILNLLPRPLFYVIEDIVFTICSNFRK